MDPVTPFMNQQEFTAASSIGLLYLIRMLGLFMVLPVLPMVGPEIDGATPLLVGLAIGIYGLSQATLQIPFGLLSDRFGRKQIIGIGLILFVVGSFVAGFSSDIYGLIAGRFLQGCGAIASTLLALMSDLTRVDQRSKSMAVVGIAIGGSFGLSLVLGPFVADSWGISGIFNLTGVLGLVGLVLLLFRIPTPTVKSVNLNSSVQKGELASVLKDLRLWRVNVSIFFLHYLLISAFSVLPLIFTRTGEIEPGDHALYYLVLLMSSFAAMMPFMWLADRLKDTRLILSVMVSLSLTAFLILGQGFAYWWVMAGTMLFFMAFNLLEVLLPAQLSKIAAAGARGTSMGVYTTCQFLGIFAGGVVSGWILSVADIATLMHANVAITVVWLSICLTFPQLGQIGSRTVQLAEMPNQPAHERVDALLSMAGVIDAVIIETDQVAYLKVDESTFDDENLNKLVA